METSKIIGIIAAILWLSIPTMAYINTWATIPTTQTTWDMRENFYPYYGVTDNGGTKYYWYSEWTNTSTTTTTDTFPHQQLTQSLEITFAPAIVLTIACYLTYTPKDEPSISDKPTKEGQT